MAQCSQYRAVDEVVVPLYARVAHEFKYHRDKKTLTKVGQKQRSKQDNDKQADLGIVISPLGAEPEVQKAVGCQLAER